MFRLTTSTSDPVFGGQSIEILGSTFNFILEEIRFLLGLVNYGLAEKNQLGLKPLRARQKNYSR